MKNFELTPEELIELRVAHKSVKNRHDAYRINAIILLGNEWTLEEVSEALLLDEETLRSYVNAYKTGGISIEAPYYSIGKTNAEIKLSNRERECIFYILRGKSVKEIATILNLSNRTIETYIENIKLKLKCRTKSKLIIRAIEEGFMNNIPKSIFSNKLAESLAL